MTTIWYQIKHSWNEANPKTLSTTKFQWKQAKIKQNHERPKRKGFETKMLKHPRTPKKANINRNWQFYLKNDKKYEKVTFISINQKWKQVGKMWQKQNGNFLLNISPKSCRYFLTHLDQHSRRKSKSILKLLSKWTYPWRNSRKEKWAK